MDCGGNPVNEDFPPCTFCTEEYDPDDRFWPDLKFKAPEVGLKDETFCSAECFAFWMLDVLEARIMDAYKRGKEDGSRATRYDCAALAGYPSAHPEGAGDYRGGGTTRWTW